LDAVVEDPIVEFQEERTRAVVSVNIREGTRYFVSMVQFSGDLPGQAEKKLSGLKKKIKNKPLSPQWKFTIRGRIEEIYGDMGYPFVQVEITEKAGEKEGDVCLDAAIKSGERARISRIKVSGNVKTYESFIKNRLLFQPGDYYSLEKKRQSFRNLFKSGLFSKVNITLKEGEGPGDNILAVQVEESPSREFSIEGGWGSYELLRIKAGFKENNIFGSGRIFRAEASGSFKGESVLSGITDPWFLNTGVTADFPLNYRRRREPSFTREELGIAPHFSKNLTEHLNMSVGYTYRGTNLSNIRVSTVEEDLNHGYNIGSLKAQANYDSRNDIFFPDSGQRSFLSCELAESGLGSQINLFRLTAGTRWFIPITSSTVLGLRYDTGFLLPGGNKVSVPISERFFNGGENSVRSFTESQLGPHDQGDPVGGLAFNLATVEIRQKIWKNFAATLFTDSGNLSPALSATFANYFKDFRHGVGFGLQYLLPIGPARLDFAMNPDPKKQYQYEEDRFALHFSIGMAF
jgi:outer membrane protein assembly complex protein YaeT